MLESIETKTITVNGTSLHYLEQGAGQAVIFVHGSLGGYDNWLDQLGPFSQHYRAIAYSRRYHDPNDWIGNGTDYSVSLHADDLIALIETLGLAPTHCVGNSFGAYTTLLAAVRRPELFGRIVLGEPPMLTWLKAIPGGQVEYDKFMTRAFLPAGDAFRQGEMEAGVRLFIDGVIGSGAFDRMPAAIRNRMLRNARELAAETAMPEVEYLSEITPRQVERLRVPILLVRGEKSPRLFHLILDRLAQVARAAQQATIPGASHNIPAGNPPEYNRVVLNFLNGKQ